MLAPAKNTKAIIIYCSDEQTRVKAGPLPNRMNTLTYIQTFYKVVQLRSFTAAAKQLGISVAAVSKQMRALEMELGVSLLERTTRRLSLTTIGQAYFREIEQVLQALEHAEIVVAAAQAEPTGLLRVKSSRFFAENVILPRMLMFRQKYPKLELDLSIAEEVPHLLEENLDVVYGMSMSVASNSIQKKISTTRYVFCASPAYLQEAGMPKKPTDLQQHNYLTHSMRSPNDKWTFPTGEVVVLKPALYLNDAATLASCAIHGLGIVALHHYQVADALAKGELVELFKDLPMPIIPLFLFYHPARFLQPKIRVWVEAMSTGLKPFM
ncbi:LysR family transcriptional regulator [Legionella jordanis]|nr:LysR family transcriptional regulator [Legionella jordanis]